MKVIYEPKGRAREYAELALNHRIGCDHGCLYCMSPLVMHKDRETFKIPIERKNILKLVEQDAIEMENNDDRRSVLMCFASDPYCHQESETRLTRKIIEIFLEHGIHYTILTKGGLRSLVDMDLLIKHPFLATYATTLTLCYGEEIHEPNAAPTLERMSALAQMHMAGIPTWVSLEPVINPVHTIQLIQSTHTYVDLYKVGKLNYVKSNIDWHQFKIDVVNVLENVGAKYMLKEDLKEC